MKRAIDSRDKELNKRAIFWRRTASVYRDLDTMGRSLYFSLLLVVPLVSGGILPKSLVVVETGGFSLRLDPNVFETCQLVRNGRIYELDTDWISLTDGGESIMLFVDDLECGFRVENVTQLHSGQWSINGVNLYDGRIYTETATIEVEKMMAYETEQRGRMSILSEEDIRSMRQFGPKAVAAQFRNSLESTIFQCDVGSVISSCQIVHRTSGKRFNIQPGLGKAPFSSYKTNFSAGVCEFEIASSFIEEARGMWKMIVRSDSEDFSCKFSMLDDLVMQRLKEKQKTVPVIKTIEASVELRCAEQVPFEIVECYIMTKQGLIFYEDQDELEAGNCKFIVAPGNWTCGFTGKERNKQHFLQKYEVRQYENELIDGMIQNNDGILIMESHHIYKEPLQTCIFVSPSEKIYAIPSDTFQSTEFTFYGGEMKKGDCGIRLSAQNFEEGDWLSIVRREGDPRQLIMNFSTL